MKTKFFMPIIALLFVSSSATVQARSSLEKQLWKNANLGWDVNQTNDYYSRNFHIGTAISDKFDTDPRAYWEIGVNLNWSRYLLYADGDLSYFNRSSLLRTQSLSFPFVMGYNVKRTFFSGMKLYTGPVYEMIFSSRLDGNPFYDLKPGQWGWTVGTKVRFFAIFSAQLAYNYYPTGLFYDGTMNRSALSLSVGL